jgi:hypothetical protein
MSYILPLQFLIMIATKTFFSAFAILISVVINAQKITLIPKNHVYYNMSPARQPVTVLILLQWMVNQASAKQVILGNI